MHPGNPRICDSGSGESDGQKDEVQPLLTSLSLHRRRLVLQTVRREREWQQLRQGLHDAPFTLTLLPVLSSRHVNNLFLLLFSSFSGDNCSDLSTHQANRGRRSLHDAVSLTESVSAVAEFHFRCLTACVCFSLPSLASLTTILH
jgi:hypothetical protein